MMKIITKKRTDDYMSFIENSPGKWESGKTIEESIGKLIVSHSKLFNIKLEKY